MLARNLRGPMAAAPSSPGARPRGAPPAIGREV
jgi:hypothetical protein